VPPKKACRAFISYDYDHDRDLKNLLVGQARNGKTPFVIADWSIKVASRGWQSEAHQRIRRADLAIVICGHHTHTAVGVSKEIAIARDLDTPIFLLRGRTYGLVRRPRGASFMWDTLYDWSWENLQKMTAKVH
jgi:hypothetical protein